MADHDAEELVEVCREGLFVFRTPCRGGIPRTLELAHALGEDVVGYMVEVADGL